MKRTYRLEEEGEAIALYLNDQFVMYFNNGLRLIDNYLEAKKFLKEVCMKNNPLEITEEFYMEKHQ